MKKHEKVVYDDEQKKRVKAEDFQQQQKIEMRRKEERP